VNLARPESEPKTALGSRLRAVRRHFGDENRQDFAKTLGISKDALALYERGENAPSAPVLAAYNVKFGVDLNWLLTSNGTMLIGGNVQVENTTLAEIRKYVWNITATFWETVPRRTKPESVADQAVEMLDYLISREGVNEDAVSEVIQFEAERLKRTSDTSD